MCFCAYQCVVPLICQDRMLSGKCLGCARCPDQLLSRNCQGCARCPDIMLSGKCLSCARCSGILCVVVLQHCTMCLPYLVVHEPCNMVLVHEGHAQGLPPFSSLLFAGNTHKTAEPWILSEFPAPFYGSEIRLVVCAYIRPEANFTSLQVRVANAQATNCLDMWLLCCLEITTAFTCTPGPCNIRQGKH